MIVLGVAGCVVIIGAWVFLQDRFRDPQPILDEARQFDAEADEKEIENKAIASRLSDPEESFNKLKELNEDTVEELRELAKIKYQDAYTQAIRTKNRELRITALRDLAELYRKMGEQRSGTVGVWRELLKFAPDHIETQRNLLDFMYESGRVMSELASPGSANWRQSALQIWEQVEQEAEKLVKILLDDPYGLLVQAHAILEQVDIGTELDPEERIVEAETLLGQAKELSPDHLLGYRLQARLVRTRSARGLDLDEDQKQAFLDESESLLRLGVEKHPDSFEAHENLYLDHLVPEIINEYQNYQKQRQELYQARARSEESEIVKSMEDKLDQSRQVTQEAYKGLDNLLQGMLDQFPDEGVFYVHQAKLREIPIDLKGRVVQSESFDLLIESLERSIQFENAPTKRYIALAVLYENRAFLSENPKPGLEMTYATVRNALYQPGATDLQHARSQEYSNNRLRILLILANVGSELLEMEEVKEKRDNIQKVVEDAIAKISDILGVEGTQTRICQGLLALALGQQDEAIRLLYSSRQDLQAINQSDSKLDLKLFHALKSTNRALASQFGLVSVHGRYRSKNLYLEVMETLSGINDPSTAGQLNFITQRYEENFGSEGTDFDKVLRYRLLALTRILPATGKDSRDEVLSSVDDTLAQLTEHDDDYRVQYLKAILIEDIEERLDRLVELSAQYPAEAELVSALYNYYVQQPDNAAISAETIGDIVTKAAQAVPENIQFRRMKLFLEAGNPAKMTATDYEKIVLVLKDSVQEAVSQQVFLGREYMNIASLAYSRQAKEAAEQYRDKAYSHFIKALEADPENLDAMDQVISMDLAKQDWNSVQERISVSQKFDLDAALGYEAQLAYAQKDWDKAVEKLELFIEQHPVSVQPYVQLASAYEAQGNLELAVETARQAQGLDPGNRGVNRTYVILLYQTYVRNSTKLNKSQLQEVVRLTSTLLGENPDDVVMLKLAAEFYPRYLVERDRELRAGAELTDAQREAQLDSLFLQIVNVFEKLIAIESGNVTLRVLLASVYENYSELINNPNRQAELVSLAEGVYQKGLADLPKSADMKTAYSRYISSKGRAAEGIQVIKDMVETSTGVEKLEAQIRLAQFYVNYGDIAAAEKTVQDILAESPDHWMAKQFMVEIYTKQKNFEAAVVVLEELRNVEDSSKLLMTHIELLMVQNKMEEAEGFLSQLKEKEPDAPMTMLVEAKLRLYSTKYDETIALCDKISELAPDMIAPYDLKARALYYNRQPHLAVECVNILRSLTGVESTQGRLLTAQIYQSNYRYNDAISELKSAVEIAPNWVEARDALIKLYGEQNKFNDLFRFLEDSIKQYPYITKYRLRLAETLSAVGDSYVKQQQVERGQQFYDRAKIIIEKALEISLQDGQPSDYDQVYHRFLGILLKTEQFEKVLSLTEKGLAEKPNGFYLYIRRAEALRSLKRQEEALVVFEKALEVTAETPLLNDRVLSSFSYIADLDTMLTWAQEKISDRPDWVSLHELLARIYTFKGDSESALASYHEALKYTNEDRRAANFKVQSAIIYGNIGQNDKAVQYYEEVLAMDYVKAKAFRTSVLNNLAYLLTQDEDQHERAVEMAREAYGLNPTSPEIMDTFASALIKQGQYLEAEKIARQAIQINQREGQVVIAELYYRLALALQGTGQDSQARDQLDAAREQLQAGYVIDEGIRVGIDDLEKTLNGTGF